MINLRQLDRVAQLLADTVAQGATVLAGGTTDGPFFRPTVVTGVSTGSALWTGMVHVNDATPQDEATAPFGGRSSRNDAG
jgi:acyl-CoA reductase-like NAD-dependent aldehyde dehydrogenase